jgi:hypothetical protein
MFTLCRPTARLLVIVPFAALLVTACEHEGIFAQLRL